MNEPTPEPAPVTPQPVEFKDSSGAAFDHSRHLTRSDGSPVINRRTGRFMPKGATARPQPAPKPEPQPAPAPEPVASIPNVDMSDIDAAAKAPEPVPEPAGAAPINPGAGLPTDKFTLLADVYTRAGLAGCIGIMGDEWSPDDDAEFIALRESVAAYLRATQKEDLPPGWALTFAVFTYSAKRLPRPKTQARIAGLKAKVLAWWRGRRVAAAVASLPGVSGGAA